MNCSFGSEESPCNLSSFGSIILPLIACRQDMTSHLVSLGISGKRGRGKTEVSESQLILNRAGLFGASNDEEIQAMTICPKHRRDLTIDWPGRKGHVCCYPNHQGTKKRINLPRRVNAAMSAEIFAAFNVVVPIGSGESSLTPYILKNRYERVASNVNKISTRTQVLCKRVGSTFLRLC